MPDSPTREAMETTFPLAPRREAVSNAMPA
jgi:hypothetical protein